MEPKMKFFYPRVKSIDRENRRITVCISKAEIDRHNERIEISAIAEALKLFATNPVVLGDHQHRLSTGKSSVIGHAPPESFKVLEDEVDMDIIFSVTENAETYWINYRDGHQKAVSIGFIDLEWRLDEEDNKKVFVSTIIDLLELSCVAVGANRGALLKAKGMFDRMADNDIKDIVTKIVGTILEEKHKEFLGDIKTSIEEMVDEIKSLLIADPDGFAERLLGNSPDSPIPAGDNSKAERSVKAVQNATSKINLRKG